MAVLSKKEPVLIFLGDLTIFTVALWLSLSVRSGKAPTNLDFYSHLVPFMILFLVWSLVFFIAGLYDKHTTILKDNLPGMIFNAQLINSFIAISFFYLIPYFGIAPKTILFLDLIISFLLIYIWRTSNYYLFGIRRKEPAFIIGSGEEMKEIEREVNNNSRIGIFFVSSINLNKYEGIDFEEDVIKKIYSENIQVVVIDNKHEKAEAILPHLYNMIFSNVIFIDFSKLYEEIFDKVPLSLLKYNWFIENISLKRDYLYDFIKRFFDIIFALIIGLISLLLYPLVFLAIKIQDGGPVFIIQERIGKNGKTIRIPKFRSMNVSDGGKWVEKDDMRITKVGSFLRRYRIDELPQLWSVIKGDMSLVGPRPDVYNLGIDLVKNIPYYSIRNIIKPGLSGWAQIRQEIVPQSFEDTKDRLSYDLYYIKNKSIFLDLKIALITIRIILSRKGK